MFWKCPSYICFPSYTRSLRCTRSQKSKRYPSYTRQPRHHHDPTWWTQSVATESVLRDSSGQLQLPPPATQSANYMFSRRSRKQRFERTRASDRSDRKKPQQLWGILISRIARNQAPEAWATSTHVTCKKNRKRANPTSQRRWYRNNT